MQNINIDNLTPLQEALVNRAQGKSPNAKEQKTDLSALIPDMTNLPRQTSMSNKVTSPTAIQLKNDTKKQQSPELHDGSTVQ